MKVSRRARVKRLDMGIDMGGIAMPRAWRFGTVHRTALCLAVALGLTGSLATACGSS